jgi:hypothetical protein
VAREVSYRVSFRIINPCIERASACQARACTGAEGFIHSEESVDEFRTELLQRVEGTYEGVKVHTYLGCVILRDLEAGKTLSSQKHYAEDVLRTHDYWECNVFLPSLL